MPTVTGRWNRLASYKTKVVATNGMISVHYHETVIVHADSDTVTLDTDGWKGATTKRKMNQASYQFDLGYHVHQQNHRWYVTTKAGRYPFAADTFTYHRDTGIPVNATFPQMALAAIGKLKHEDCTA